MPVSKVISSTDVPLLTEHRLRIWSRIGASAFGTIFFTKSAGISVHASVIFAALAAYKDLLPLLSVDDCDCFDDCSCAPPSTETGSLDLLSMQPENETTIAMTGTIF